MKMFFHLIIRYLWKIKLKYLLLGIGIILIIDTMGLFTHIMEIRYNDENFSYPYEGDVHQSVQSLRNKQEPEIPSINTFNQTFIITPKQSCDNHGEYHSLRIVYIVKSSIEHFDRRIAIRNTWGFEKRFFDVTSRTIFLLGVRPGDKQLEERVRIESQSYNDILQADFIDNYYNNTIKTITGFRWAALYCPKSKFYMFLDDDIYVSVKNVLQFVRNPTNYPNYLKEPKRFAIVKREIDHLNNSNIIKSSNNKNQSNNGILIERRNRRQIFDIELPEDVRLYAGYVFISAPHRHKTSKWYVSLEEYPYHLWPPYVTAGAYIVSREALLDMYYTSLYTKLFKFDDIFLGLIAKKADIEPFHCEEFHFYKKDYNKYNYKYVITSHGYGDPEELMQVWNEQKAMGNA